MLTLLTSFISPLCFYEELQLVVTGRTEKPELGLVEEQGCQHRARQL